MGHFLFPLLKLHHSPAKKSLTSLLLCFLLCRTQLCGLLLISLDLETSKVGDASWSHLKQKGVETKPSSLRVLKLFSAYKEQLPSPAVTMALKTPFTIHFYEGPHPPDVNVRQFGFHNPKIQAQDAHTSTWQLSKLGHGSLFLSQRDQNRSLVGILGKLQANQEVLN